MTESYNISMQCERQFFLIIDATELMLRPRWWLTLMIFSLFIYLKMMKKEQFQEIIMIPFIIHLLENDGAVNVSGEIYYSLWSNGKFECQHGYKFNLDHYVKLLKCTLAFDLTYNCSFINILHWLEIIMYFLWPDAYILLNQLEKYTKS